MSTTKSPCLGPCAPVQLSVLFLKPVQTGFPADSDARLVAAAAGLPVVIGPHAAQLLPGIEQHAVAAGEAAADGTVAKTLYAWQQPVSPHVAVETEGRPVSNRQVTAAVAAELRGFAAAGGLAGSSRSQQQQRQQIAIVETAGGVASPGPSGTLQASKPPGWGGWFEWVEGGVGWAVSCGHTPACMPGQPARRSLAAPSTAQQRNAASPPCLQCDLLRPLRLPGILVGDGRLGGISATLSSYDALSLRGHSVPLVVLMEGPDEGRLGNVAAIQKHLRGRATVLGFPECLPPPAATEAGAAGSAAQQAQQIDANLAAWLQQSAPHFDALLGLAAGAHAERVRQLAAAAGEARSMLWWPFTQHGSVAGDAGVTVIDSRAGESFCVYRPPAGAAGTGVSGVGSEAGSLDFQYDACASWWTQGVSCRAAADTSAGPSMRRSSCSCMHAASCMMRLWAVTSPSHSTAFTQEKQKLPPPPFTPTSAGGRARTAAAGAGDGQRCGTLRPRHVPGKRSQAGSGGEAAALVWPLHLPPTCSPAAACLRLWAGAPAPAPAASSSITIPLSQPAPPPPCLPAGKAAAGLCGLWLGFPGLLHRQRIHRHRGACHSQRAPPRQLPTIAGPARPARPASSPPFHRPACASPAAILALRMQQSRRPRIRWQRSDLRSVCSALWLQVALKMAFRKYMADHGLMDSSVELQVGGRLRKH